MTDKKLLELAAKAAGEYGEWVFNVYKQGRLVNGLWQDLCEVCWNPLTDDGDALRLAVKLGFNVSCDLHEDKETIVIFHRGKWEIEKHGRDPCAATRRAIVRAAAEIGRTK